MSVGKRETDDWTTDRRETLETGPGMHASKRKTVLNGYCISEMETEEMRCRQAENARLVNGKWVKYLTVSGKANDANTAKRKSKRCKYCQAEKQTMQILSSGKANDANTAKRKSKRCKYCQAEKQTMHILPSGKANDANTAKRKSRRCKYCQAENKLVCVEMSCREPMRSIPRR